MSVRSFSIRFTGGPPLRRFAAYTAAIATTCGLISFSKEAHELIRRRGRLQFRSAQRQTNRPVILQRMQRWWFVENSPADRARLGLLGVNAGICGLWQVQAASPRVGWYLNRLFVAGISDRAFSLTGAAFSHQSLLHLGANMLALDSFGRVLGRDVGPLQLLGLYVGAGTISSFASVAVSSYAGRVAPSVGASGAVLAIFAAVTLHRPDTHVNLLFIPYPLSGMAVLKGLVLFDIAGAAFMLAFRRSMLGSLRLDHVAHLAGVAVGMAWMTYMKRSARHDSTRKGRLPWE